jgi:fluoride ion exporter CrcB/FEX
LEVKLRLTLIAISGAVGTLARYGLQGLVQIRAGTTFSLRHTAR